MSSKKISVEKFIKEEGISLKIIDSTNYSVESVKKILKINSKEGLDNINIFDFSKPNTCDNLINICNTYPYLSKYRFVVIHGLKESDSETIQEINDYLTNPMKTTKHIFIFDNKKINIICDFENEETESESDMIKFIEKELKNRSLKLKDKNIAQLAQKSSDKLSVLSYLTKLESLNKTDDMNETLISNLISDQRNEVFKETYDLIKYINNKNLKGCLLEVQKTKFKENIFLEISRLTWRFRTYLKIKSLKNQSLNNQDIIKTTKISKYQYKYFEQETNKKSMNDILESLRALKEVDQLLKSTNLNHENIMLNLFNKLCKS